MSDVELISTEADLAGFAARMAGSPWLAVDTEFMRETTYYPQLCLIQVGNGDAVACIDPLAIDNLDPLLDLLYRRDILKVFHAASQDLEIFCHLRGKPPGPLFDTQVAATLAGHGEQIGYGGLVEQVLGIHLDKKHSRNDWAQRPLKADELRYAADDVVYLAQVYEKLREDLESRGRLEWLEEDFAALEDPETYLVTPDAAWKRVKGAGRLPGASLACIRTLAAWRERVAQQEDRPRRRVLRDDVLIDIARRRPQNLSDLKRVRDLHDRMLRHYGDDLLEAVRAADDLEVPPRPRRPKDSGQALGDVLMGVLRNCAEQADVTTGAIASRKDLEALARGERDLRLTRGWRYRLAGEALLDIVEGRSAISVDDGAIRVQRSEG